jgi:hypothetical protein
LSGANRWWAAGLLTIVAFVVTAWVLAAFVLPPLMASQSDRWVVAAGAGTAVGALAALWGQSWATQAAATSSTSAQIAEAADRLAEIVLGQWQIEAKARAIVTPAPAMVQWRWGSSDVVVDADEVMNTLPAPGTAPRPMCGPMDDGSTGLLESGVVTRLHDEVYARLPHGRLILLGGPGAGKTGAMILILLAALDHRRIVPEGRRSDVPVPVWLTMGGWNPATTKLLEWVRSTISRDHP